MAKKEKEIRELANKFFDSDPAAGALLLSRIAGDRYVVQRADITAMLNLGFDFKELYCIMAGQSHSRFEDLLASGAFGYRDVKMVLMFSGDKPQDESRLQVWFRYGPLDDMHGLITISKRATLRIGSGISIVTKNHGTLQYFVRDCASNIVFFQKRQGVLTLEYGTQIEAVLDDGNTGRWLSFAERLILYGRDWRSGKVEK